MVKEWKNRWAHFSLKKSRDCIKDFNFWIKMVQGNWNPLNCLMFLNCRKIPL